MANASTYFNAPVIAAARDKSSLLHACQSSVEAIFLLRSDILSLHAQVEKIHNSGKKAFVHLDLMDGIAADQSGVRFVARCFKPDGLISTKPSLLRHAQVEGLITIQRIFLMDSSSLENGMRLAGQLSPDYIEVLPGIVPKAISRLAGALKPPIIAGGMITQPDEVRLALSAGAVAISTSCASLWSFR